MKTQKTKYCQSKKCRIIMLAFLLLGLSFWFSLPSKLFQDPTSTILFSREGNLLGARIALDGQWRFPESEQVPKKFEKALLSFEDSYFYYHPGVNPVSLGRALIQNLKAGHVVSGGSTISMQLIRISRKAKRRNLYQKLVEMIKSLRLELGYSKKEILALYASHAPFGGNVVGLEAAAWRFFGRKANDLSWAESATLAVLPNAPSLIYPGKNSRKLRNKRNRLLDRLVEREIIDSTTCELAKLEEIPSKIHSLPMLASHLLDQANLEYRGERIKTSINYRLQLQVNEIIGKHQRNLEANQIHNMAVLVLDVETGQSIAYVGNTSRLGKENHANQVDVIRAPRSTGSVLKPFLFASMLNGGEILPNTLVPDIPTQIAGYSPKNFNLRYDGAVPAQKALSRSLNVPSVRMLRNYGVERFHHMMKSLGMSTLNRPSGHYGLSLILGGAEGALWDLCGIYAGLARSLKHYNDHNKTYFSNNSREPSYRLKDSVAFGKIDSHPMLNAASIYQTFEALLEVNRPDGENGWKSFSSSRKVAWKTGTSFGFRDAWAIGTTPNYVIGVWVGNADGEGRPGLTGVGAAAPVMFDVFNLLPSGSWFDIPFEEMEEIPVCRKSGYRAGRWCETVDTMLVCKTGLETNSCPYHRLVHLDSGKRYQVNSQCEKVTNMQHVNWFVLPPAMEWYYKKRHALYRPLPPFREDCSGVNQNTMELIYPRGNDQIFVPIDLDGIRGKVVFEIAHHDPEAEVFWHLDGNYLGSTVLFHQKELSPDEGEHLLSLVDNHGNTLYKKFTVVGKKENEID